MSGSIRLFVSSHLQPGEEVAGTPGQAHYLGTVMRRGMGDAVLLFNGTDGEWRARITALRRDRVTLALEEPTRLQTPEPDVWLVFAPLKRHATELVVEKATELGVAALVPVITERTNTPRLNLERLAAIAIEAAEQSERLTVPRVEPPEPLSALLADWPAGRPLVVAMERWEAPPPPPMLDAAALLVGPEGGFTGAELDTLRRCPFVVPASLGPRVLRAETAAIAGLALLQTSRPP